MIRNNEISFGEFDFITESLNDNQSRLILASAAVAPDFKNNECINKELFCVGFATRPLVLDGKELLNVILIDEDGNSYSTISSGIKKVVESWIVNNVSPTWEEPIRVKYCELSKGSYRFYTLKTALTR